MLHIKDYCCQRFYLSSIRPRFILLNKLLKSYMKILLESHCFVLFIKRKKKKKDKQKHYSCGFHLNILLEKFGQNYTYTPQTFSYVSFLCYIQEFATSVLIQTAMNSLLRFARKFEVNASFNRLISSDRSLN